MNADERITHEPDRIGDPAEGSGAIRERLARVVEPAIAAHHCELVELEYRREPIGWVLRLYVERKGHDPRHKIGGVGIDECARISRDVSTALDVADAIAHAYHLEVSSPGLERPLTKPEHWQRFVGLLAKVRLDRDVDGHASRRVVRGEILALEEGDRVRLLDEEVGEVTFPVAAVAKAHLVYASGPKPKPGKKKKSPHVGGRAGREGSAQRQTTPRAGRGAPENES